MIDELQLVSYVYPPVKMHPLRTFSILAALSIAQLAAAQVLADTPHQTVAPWRRAHHHPIIGQSQVAYQPPLLARYVEKKLLAMDHWLSYVR